MAENTKSPSTTSSDDRAMQVFVDAVVGLPEENIGNRIALTKSTYSRGDRRKKCSCVQNRFDANPLRYVD